jgi:hypothetical protein
MYIVYMGRMQISFQVSNLDVNPFGQSMLTEAWKRMAQTSQ